MRSQNIPKTVHSLQILSKITLGVLRIRITILGQVEHVSIHRKVAETELT